MRDQNAYETTKAEIQGPDFVHFQTRPFVRRRSRIKKA
jgi:hypothetical protein